MSSATVIDALEKRGYITAEARERLMQKRASLIVNHISEQTKLAAGGGGVVDRFGKAFEGTPMRQGAGKGWPEWIAAIGRVMGVGAGLAAGGAAVGAAGHAIGNIGVKKKIQTSKNEVLGMLAEKNPEIKRQQNIVFDAIARYAPTLASDPLIATGIVNGIANGRGTGLNIPHVDANFAKQLAEAETMINKSRSSTRFGQMHEKVHSGVANQFDFGDKPQRG